MKHRYTNKLPPKNANETCRGIKASKEKNLEDLEAMTKEELIQELVKAWITEARLKRLRSERRWSGNIEEYLPLPAAVRCRRIRILYELFSAPKQQINFFFSSSAVAVSRGGIPTDNAAMEAINGWVKAELFTDFHVTDNNKIKQEIAEYITFFYEQRPAYPLSYQTPKQFRESYSMNIAV